MFSFEPFKKEFNKELMVSEFVADGSLGHFPFITEESHDSDKLGDCTGEDCAFCY